MAHDGIEIPKWLADGLPALYGLALTGVGAIGKVSIDWVRDNGKAQLTKDVQINALKIGAIELAHVTLERTVEQARKDAEIAREEARIARQKTEECESRDRANTERFNEFILSVAKSQESIQEKQEEILGAALGGNPEILESLNKKGQTSV